MVRLSLTYRNELQPRQVNSHATTALTSIAITQSSWKMAKKTGTTSSRRQESPHSRSNLCKCPPSRNLKSASKANREAQQLAAQKITWVEWLANWMLTRHPSMKIQQTPLVVELGASLCPKSPANRPQPTPKPPWITTTGAQVSATTQAWQASQEVKPG